MPKTFVAFDLETTGLDPKTDTIIEIAMVRFDESGILEEFSSLVNPGMPIPEEVTNITGITHADVANAPFFGDIRDRIISFFWESIILAHNADFDTAFLVGRGFDFSTRAIVDTFRLAQIAFMGERSMNLSNLAEVSGFFHEWAHRALSDARATVAVYREALARIRSARATSSAAYRFLASITPVGSTFHTTIPFAVHSDSTKNIEPLSAPELFSHLVSEIPEYREIPEPNFPEVFPLPESVLLGGKLESRGEQAKMAELVTTAFEKKELFAIEAPTGIGKTFAYMIPSVIHAARNSERVVISTNTKTLQDQIEKKDVPKIRELFASHGISNFRFAKLKGRTNYASLLKLSEFSQKESFSEEEALFFGKICVYLSQNRSWELDDFSAFGREYELLSEIHSGDSRVLLPDNPYRKQEPLYRAREAIKTADIVLVNHALLLTEIADDAPGSIWKLSSLVIDEAHNLEAAATDALTCTFSLSDCEKLFSRIESAIRRHNRSPGAEKFLFPELREISDSFALSFGIMVEFCERYAFVKGWSAPRPEYGKGRMNEILVTSDFFTTEGISGIPPVVSLVFEKVKDLSERLSSAPEKLSEAFSTPLSEISGLARFFEEFFSPSRQDLIKIVSIREWGDCRLKVAPLDVSKILREKLWNRLSSGVITSATLTIGDEFDFLKKSLGLEGFTFRILDSDFDYSKQAMVFLPTDLGDVRNEAERKRTNMFIRDAVIASGGRTLGLFTSFAAIKEAYLQINTDLRNKGIKLLVQGLSGGKHKMLEEFKRSSSNSALFGTDSFWEGIDIPGKDLELLLIHKFPFAVPTDPIVMARSKLYADAFSEYSLPQMLLKLRQGIGRLIRTKEDRGVVVILDSRVRSSWGNDTKKAYPKGIRIRSGETATFTEMIRQKRATTKNDLQEVQALI